MTTQASESIDPQLVAGPVFEDVFDEDYLYFYGPSLSPDRNQQDAALVWKLLSLSQGQMVLDLACGHGRIANLLAARGAHVIGQDACPLFLEVARADATARGVNAVYEHVDMRLLQSQDEFDAVLLWFSSLGYYDDETDFHILERIRTALKPMGRLIIEQASRTWLLRNWTPLNVIERGDDFMIDRRTYDPALDRSDITRTIVRSNNVRRVRFSVRLYGLPELKDMLSRAGFCEIIALDEKAEPYSSESSRLIVVSTKKEAWPPS